MGLRMNDIIKAVRDHDLIITPRLNDHLMQRGDDELPVEVADIIHEQLVTKPRVRSASFSGSSAGQCYRAQELAFLGMPQQGAIGPRLQNIFNDGTWRHLRWQAMLLHAGILDRIEIPLFWRNMKARGTMDGIGTVPDDHPRESIRGLEFGFELKGANPFVYHKAVKQDQGVKEEHENQVARYFLLGGYDLFVTIYENKATQEWYEWVSFPDMERIEAQRQELLELNGSIDTQQLHPMLPQCKIETGAFKECAYGQSAAGACPRAGDWPNIKKNKKRK